MTMSDGSGGIYLQVGIDKTELDKDLKKIKARASELDKAFENVENTIQSALNVGNTKVATLANTFKKATEEVEKQSAKVDELRAKLAELKSGEVSSPKLTKMQTELKKTNTSIEKTKQEIFGLYAQLDNLQHNAFKVPDTGDLMLTRAEQAEVDSLNAKLDTLEAKLEADKQKAIELGTNLRNATGAATQAEIEKTAADLANAENKLDNLSTNAEIVWEKINTAMEEIKNSTNGFKEKISTVSEGFSKLGERLLRLAKNVFVFSVISSALRGVRSAISNVIMSDKEMQKSLEQLKGSLWTAFAPIYNFIIPAIRTFINALNSAMVEINKFIAKITGTTYKALTESGKALQDQVKGYNDLADSAKKTKKELASFDEIETLSRNTTTDSITTNSIGSAAQSELSAIATTIVGAAMVGLGLILMFTSHFLLGLGLVIAGGLMIWKAAPELSKTLDVDLKNRIIKICDIVGKVAFMLGLILLFVPGCFLFGLGLMALGVSALAVSSRLENPDNAIKELKEKIINLVGLAGLVAFMLGIILIFLPGCIWQGLGLMALGASAVGVSEHFSSDGIVSAIKDFCEKSWKALFAIGIVMVCVGIALLFTKTAWATGLKLILLGAVDLIGTAHLASDAIKEAYTSFCDKYWMELKQIAVVTFIIGIVLIFTGQFQVGLALLGLGAIGLEMEGSFSSKSIQKEIEEKMEELQNILLASSVVLLVLGVIFLFIPGCQAIGIACLQLAVAAGIGALGLNSKPKILDSSAMVNEVNKSFSPVKHAVEKNITDIDELMDDFNKRFSFADATGITYTAKKNSISIQSSQNNTKGVSVKVPGYAKGAVIPGGRAFAAVLGDQPAGQTNVEAPAELIKQMAIEAYQEMGLTGGQQQVIKEEHYNLNQTELMTIIYKLVKGGERLNGASLVKQGGI